MAEYPLIIYKPTPTPQLGFEMPFWPVVCAENEITKDEYITAVKKFTRESLWKVLLHHDHLPEDLSKATIKNLNTYRYKDLAGPRKPRITQPEKGTVSHCNRSKKITCIIRKYLN